MLSHAGTFGALLQEFLQSDALFWCILAIALDFVFGVAAALKLGVFRLSYVADFLRNDVAFKLVPYITLWWGAHLAGGRDLPGGFIELEQIADATFLALMAAWAASIAGSLYQLGFMPGQPTELKEALLADENAAPPKS